MKKGRTCLRKDEKKEGGYIYAKGGIEGE